MVQTSLFSWMVIPSTGRDKRAEPPPDTRAITRSSFPARWQSSSISCAAISDNSSGRLFFAPSYILLVKIITLLPLKDFILQLSYKQQKKCLITLHCLSYFILLSWNSETLFISPFHLWQEPTGTLRIPSTIWPPIILWSSTAIPNTAFPKPINETFLLWKQSNWQFHDFGIAQTSLVWKFFHSLPRFR